MRRVVFWLLLLAAALALVIFLSRNRQDLAGALSSDDIGALITKIVMLVLVGGAAMAVFRDRLSKALEAAIIWAIIGLLLVLGYTYRFELRDVYEQVLTELVPGRARARGHVVEISRGQTGEFQVFTEVNGRRVPMILDTGASSVVLTNEAARAIGLPLELIKYTVEVETANGRARAGAVTLDRVATGNIVERAVPALIAQPGQLRTSLLGMSYLNRLQSWEVRGDRLIMRGYP
jgi:aspartyl protease family protein